MVSDRGVRRDLREREEEAMWRLGENSMPAEGIASAKAVWH